MTDHQKIITLYAAFAATIILTCLPHVWAAGLSLVTLLGVMIYGYRLKKQGSLSDFVPSHAAFIIGTIWASGILSVISMSAASFYMLPAIDHAPFEPCTQTIANQSIEFLEKAGFDDIWPLAQPCMDAFIAANMPLLINSALIAILPLALYILWRLGRGLPRAFKSQAMPKPDSWL